MDTLTHSILIISAVCLTLGAINFRFWLSERSRLDFLAITVSCTSVAVYSWFEVGMMHADTPAEFGQLLRWAHLPGLIAILSVAWFVLVHLNAGRRWLFWAIVVTRTAGSSLNIFLTPNVNFREITAITHTIVLGESLSAPVGVPNPLVLINHFAALLFIVFCVDAAITVWRRGDHRKAVTFGIGVVLFSLFMFAALVTAVWGSIGMPFIASVGFFFVIASMAYELNYDMHHSARLAEDLRRREAELNEMVKQLGMSADAADVGIWTKNIGDKRIWASDKWFEIFGLEPSRTLTFERFFRRVHPDDAGMVEDAIVAARNGGIDYSVVYRVILPDGELRWISSLGKFEFEDGKAKYLRGASVDITKRKVAEQSAHALSRKLMGAQEKERARLARELHDDLSQSLALLSIQLQSLSGESVKPTTVKRQVGELTEQIQRLSLDVHRISHELHPSKLNQLGLEAALRGFCRETGAAHGMKVRFEAKGVPRNLPNDISLCVYRIAQESLQNAVKHSGAAFANVILEAADGEIRLVVSDNGCGFDPDSLKSKESLGLVSMEERIRAVNGKLTIESVTDAGTKIAAVVPIAAS